MIDILITIILIELVILLAVLIVYWIDYTNSYIHCHHKTVPCKCNKYEHKSNYDKLIKAIESYEQLTEKEEGIKQEE